MQPKGPSNTVLAGVLAAVVLLAGGLVLWAMRSTDSNIPPPAPVSSDLSEAASPIPDIPPITPSPLPSPVISTTPSTIAPKPPPPPTKKYTPVRRAPVRTTPTVQPTTTPPDTYSDEPTTTRTSRSHTPKSSRNRSDDSDFGG